MYTFTLFNEESSTCLLRKVKITNVYRYIYLALNVQDWGLGEKGEGIKQKEKKSKSKQTNKNISWA